MSFNDRYAGDAAWRQWFEKCSLEKCEDAYRRPLIDEVISALTRAIKSRQCQMSYGKDYLVAYFDHHFKLGGSCEKPKPLKQLLLAKATTARNKLRGVVLGSILSGEVRTMSRNMKFVEDGTLTRWYTDPKSGTKVLQVARSFDAVIRQGNGDYENNEEITLHDINITSDIDTGCQWTTVQFVAQDPDVDNQWFRQKAKESVRLYANDDNGGKTLAVVAMIYARSHSISPTKPVIRRLLGGMSPAGAAKKIHQMEDYLRKFCKKNDIRSEGIEFAGALLEVATAILKKEGVLQELEEIK